MPKHNLTPTLLIGLGGTGVAVLRKFKRLYMEVNDEADQYIKLLAIDTDEQLPCPDPPLDNSEFYQLAKPDPIEVADVLRQARRGTRALEWLQSISLPAFRIERGAGMKRLQGHLAYFWRGEKIRKRIEETIKPLLEANPNLQNEERASSVRIFVISSLCGGTGTGMFLDLAYMARDVIEGGGGPKVKNFGLLFLPSAFQQLKTKPAWAAIHANGYSALQELNYYMDTPFRDTKLYMPGVNHRPQLELDASPFQYCFLVGGVNERGDHVRHSDDLYERTADFLFMNVTTSIGDTLVAHEVENRSLEHYSGSKAFAAFGSFSMSMPQARDMQKYLLLMGRELLDDVLIEEPKQPWVADVQQLFEKIDEMVEVRNLASGSADLPFASEFVDGILQHHPEQVSPEKANDAISTQLREIQASTQKFDQQLNLRAQNLRDAITRRTMEELKANWTLAPGTIGGSKALLGGVLALLQRLSSELEPIGRKSYEELSSIEDRHRGKTVGPVRFGKPSVSAFRIDLANVFLDRAKVKLAEEYLKALAAARDELTVLQRTIDQLRLRADDLKSQYRSDALKLLNQTAKEESRAFLADPRIEEETSAYGTERLPLWQHCQAQPQLRALLRSPRDGSLDTVAFALELFKVIRAYVTEHSLASRFDDLDRLNTGLQDAKINLKLRGMYHLPETSSMLFVDADQGLSDELCDAIQNAPGDFGRPQPYRSLDQGSMTFVRIMSSFALDDLADIQFMGDCYQERKRLVTEGLYLDLPTHRRADILGLGGEDEGVRLFALARALDRIEEVGQNFLFDDDRLLPVDEADPLERRQRGYAAVLRSDVKTRIEQILEKRVRSLGGNEQFVPDMEGKVNEKYPTEKLQGSDPLCGLLSKERDAALAYLLTLGVVRAQAKARTE